MTRCRVLAAVAGLAVMATACDHLLTKPLMYTSVNVRAERRDGTPIGGAPIELFTGQRPMAYDSTNGAGLALFQFVPAGPAYGLQAEAPAGYAFPELLLGGPPTNVIAGFALSADSAPHFTFQFLRIGPGTVNASVMDQAGKPIAGADVALYSATALLQHATTSTAGTVSFSAVPFGVYGVITPMTGLYSDFNEPSATWQDGLLIEQGVTATATLTLHLCQGNVNLTVADPVYGAAPGLQTYLYTATATVDSATTGSDGRVAYVTACGNYGVRVVPNLVWAVAPGRGTEFADGLQVHRGSVTNVALRAQYNTCRGAIHVTVADSTSAPVSGAILLLFTANNQGNFSQVETGGALTFANLSCGIERGVQITPPAGWSARPGRGGNYVDGLSVTNGTTLNVGFTLARIAP
jgi:hypothetical protein